MILDEFMVRDRNAVDERGAIWKDNLTAIVLGRARTRRAARDALRNDPRIGIFMTCAERPSSTALTVSASRSAMRMDRAAARK